jgi:hypothetical protein
MPRNDRNNAVVAKLTYQIMQQNGNLTMKEAVRRARAFYRDGVKDLFKP